MRSTSAACASSSATAVFSVRSAAGDASARASFCGAWTAARAATAGSADTSTAQASAALERNPDSQIQLVGRVALERVDVAVVELQHDVGMRAERQARDPDPAAILAVAREARRN